MTDTKLTKAEKAAEKAEAKAAVKAAAKDVPRDEHGSVLPPVRDADGNIQALPDGRGNDHRIEFRTPLNPNDLPKDENGKLLPIERTGPTLKDGERIHRHPLDDNRPDGALALLMRTPPEDVTFV